MSCWRCIFLVVLLFPCAGVVEAEEAPLRADNAESVRFGVFPFVPPGLLEYRFRALTQALSRELKQPVSLETRANFESFRQALDAKEFDIALVQPWDYFAVRTEGYVGLVQKHEALQGAFYTLDDALSGIEQLRGKTVAFPDRLAAVTRLAAFTLEERGLSEGDYEAVYLADHESCLLAVASQVADACATTDDIGNRSIQASSMTYRIFARTDSMPPILIVLSPTLINVQQQLQQWFVALAKNEKGRDILNESYLEKLIEARDEEYLEWFEQHFQKVP